MPRLEVRDVVMQFPAVRALDGVSLSFEEGEIHGIIGENGAGKSTLMRILAGLQEPTSAEIWISKGRLSRTDRTDRTDRADRTDASGASKGSDSLERGSFRSVRDALALGIAMIHQELNLVDPLTVAQNVFLGREPRRFGMLDRGKMRARTQGYLEQVGATLDPDAPVSELSLAQKQLAEIAKALSYEASILIMDEPTSVLSEQEAANLFSLIGRLKESGVTVIYISHRLAEVEQICDRITVFRDGRLIKTLKRGEASQAEMASMMVGRELGEVFPEKTPPPDAEPILSAQEISDGDRVRGVSFDLRPGEILGLAGLMGSGRTELCEMLVGIRPCRSDSEANGGPARSPSHAAKRGIAYVSEDRRDTGLVLPMDVIENTTLANLKKYSKPLIRKREEESATREWVKALDIRVGDLRAPVLYLSGGNQQKVSLAKWLELKPKVLLLDEPTRGVDVGAKRELYALIHRLAKEGMACILVSSEMLELVGLCHRVLVMREGRVVGELTGNAITEDAIMQLAAGVLAA